MGVSAAQSYLSDILHVVSQGLLIPTILLLLGFIAYALFCIGSVVSEYFTERKYFQVQMPKFLAALTPRFPVCSTFIRLSFAAYSSSIASEPSVEPSSMQIASQSANVCANTESKHSRRYGATL